MAFPDNTPSPFLIIGLVIFAILVLTGGSVDISSDRGDTSNTSQGFLGGNNSATVSRDDDQPLVYSLTSEWEGKVTLSRGNAASERQVHKEYIVISARSSNQAPVNITGWALTNNRAGKDYQLGSQTIRVSGQRVLIPRAATLLVASGNQTLGDVILDPGDRAYVTTGNPPLVGPVKISSFQTNICTGYIEQLDHYQFTPSLRRDCPDPEDEPRADQLEEACWQFVRRLNRCQTPEFPDYVMVKGIPEPGYVDNTPGLSTSCKNYLKSHYNYQSCVANYIGTEDFYSRDWRLYLNQPFELWGRTREVISLYDRQGRLVDEISY